MSKSVALSEREKAMVKLSEGADLPGTLMQVLLQPFLPSL